METNQMQEMDASCKRGVEAIVTEAAALPTEHLFAFLYGVILGSVIIANKTSADAGAAMLQKACREIAPKQH